MYSFIYSFVFLVHNFINVRFIEEILVLTYTKLKGILIEVMIKSQYRKCFIISKPKIFFLTSRIH